MAGLTTEPRAASFGRAVLVRVGIGVGAATALVVLVGLFLPRTFSVERSVVVAASPARIHPWLDDLSRWAEWTPWLEDASAVTITSGARTTGAGASLTWTGDSGGGRLALLRSEPAWGVAYDMAFAGNKYPSTGALRLGPEADGTRVTWSMVGDVGWNPLERYFGLALGSLIGPMFEEGLARLEMLAESADSTAVAP